MASIMTISRSSGPAVRAVRTDVTIVIAGSLSQEPALF